MVTARYRPGRRRAGSPTTTATTAPADPASSNARLRSNPQVEVATAPTAPPTATNDICPSDTWPAHPVSTTTDKVMRQKAATVAAFSSFDGPRKTGRATAAASTSSGPTARSTRTTVSEASSRGMGRTSSAAVQLDTASALARVVVARRTTSDTSTTAASTTYTRPGLLG